MIRRWEIRENNLTSDSVFLLLLNADAEDMREVSRQLSAFCTLIDLQLPDFNYVFELTGITDDVLLERVRLKIGELAMDYKEVREVSNNAGSTKRIDIDNPLPETMINNLPNHTNSAQVKEESYSVGDILSGSDTSKNSDFYQVKNSVNLNTGASPLQLAKSSMQLMKEKDPTALNVSLTSNLEIGDGTFIDINKSSSRELEASRSVVKPFHKKEVKPTTMGNVSVPPLEINSKPVKKEEKHGFFGKILGKFLGGDNVQKAKEFASEIKQDLKQEVKSVSTEMASFNEKSSNVEQEAPRREVPNPFRNLGNKKIISKDTPFNEKPISGVSYAKDGGLISPSKEGQDLKAKIKVEDIFAAETICDFYGKNDDDLNPSDILISSPEPAQNADISKEIFSHEETVNLSSSEERTSSVNIKPVEVAEQQEKITIPLETKKVDTIENSLPQEEVSTLKPVQTFQETPVQKEILPMQEKKTPNSPLFKPSRPKGMPVAPAKPKMVSAKPAPVPPQKPTPIKPAPAPVKPASITSEPMQTKPSFVEKKPEVKVEIKTSQKQFVKRPEIGQQVSSLRSVDKGASANKDLPKRPDIVSIDSVPSKPREGVKIKDSMHFEPKKEQENVERKSFMNEEKIREGQIYQQSAKPANNMPPRGPDPLTITKAAMARSTSVEGDTLDHTLHVATSVKSTRQSNWPIEMPLVPAFTFDTMDMASNRFAHASVMTTIDNLGTMNNPFLIYGEGGTGKTHFLNAMAYEISKKIPQEKILYTNGVRFARGAQRYAEDGRQEKLKNFFESAQVLIIDDIHLTAVNEQNRELISLILNSFLKNRKQIIISSKYPPESLNRFEELVKFNLSQGLVSEMKTPKPQHFTRICNKMVLEASLGITEMQVQSFFASSGESLGAVARDIKRVKVLHRRIESSGKIKKSYEQILNEMSAVNGENENSEIVKKDFADIVSLQKNENTQWGNFGFFFPVEQTDKFKWLAFATQQKAQELGIRGGFSFALKSSYSTDHIISSAFKIANICDNKGLKGAIILGPSLMKCKGPIRENFYDILTHMLEVMMIRCGIIDAEAIKRPSAYMRMLGDVLR